MKFFENKNRRLLKTRLNYKKHFQHKTSLKLKFYFTNRKPLRLPAEIDFAVIPRSNKRVFNDPACLTYLLNRQLSEFN